MEGSSLELVAARLRRQRARGARKAAWRCAVTLTVREEREPRWWMLRAALALALAQSDEAVACARQAGFLLRRQGRAGAAMAVSMWLSRRGLRDDDVRRAS
ncbi:MAG: hypothetical protein U0325_26485 [Polyangiales bacterium]